MHNRDDQQKQLQSSSREDPLQRQERTTRDSNNQDLHCPEQVQKPSSMMEFSILFL
jgi:hypothetical protein